MLLTLTFLCISSFMYAADDTQKQLELAWQITRAEITLAQNHKAPKRNLSNYLKSARHDTRWKTVKELPETQKEDFFNLIRNITVNNPNQYNTMRNLIAGCAWAGCSIEKFGFDEERLFKLIEEEKKDSKLLRIVSRYPLRTLL